MGLGIDFHYADSWADPGKQPKPRAWAELEFDALVEALRTFTGDYLRRLVDQGLTPDKVAIGNEIINGFMWGSESEYAIPLDPDSPVNPQYFRDQAESAFTVFTLPQYLAFAVLVLGLVAALWAEPVGTLLLLNIPVTLFFLAVVVFRTWVGVSGAGAETAISFTEEEVRGIDTRTLPTYTILVPVYQERRVIGRLLASLAALDYPRDKLDIIILFEEDDPETLAAAKAAAPGANVRFLIVPAGEPQTKPKACNVGLLYAQGEHLVNAKPEGAAHRGVDVSGVTPRRGRGDGVVEPAHAQRAIGELDGKRRI